MGIFGQRKFVEKHYIIFFRQQFRIKGNNMNIFVLHKNIFKIFVKKILCRHLQRHLRSLGFFFQVNVLFSSCVAGYATCNCGVAVRSNLSLYVVRTCAQVSSTQTELLTFPYEKLTLNKTSDLHVSKLGRLFEVIKF